MAIAQREDLHLHYEVTPAETSEPGLPVLLVMGLGVSATGWWRTIPVLASDRPVLAFDNRGVGRSDRAPGPVLHSRDGRGRDRRARRRRGSTARTSTESRSAARSPRRSRCATPIAWPAWFSAPRCQAESARHARRGHAHLLPAPCRDAGLRGGLGLGPLLLRRGDPPPPCAADRRRPRAAAALPGRAGALRGAARPPRSATTRAIGSARSPPPPSWSTATPTRMVPAGQRAGDRRRHPRRPSSSSGPAPRHLYPTDEPEADRSVARFLAEIDRDGA